MEFPHVEVTVLLFRMVPLAILPVGFFSSTPDDTWHLDESLARRTARQSYPRGMIDAEGVETTGKPPHGDVAGGLNKDINQPGGAAWRSARTRASSGSGAKDLLEGREEKGALL